METMTARERMITAIKNKIPDRVPVAPDFSTMIPARLNGKPWFEVFVNNNPPLWKAYIEAVKHFGIDGWFILGNMQFKGPAASSTDVSGKGDSRSIRYNRTDGQSILSTITSKRKSQRKEKYNVSTYSICHDADPFSICVDFDDCHCCGEARRR